MFPSTTVDLRNIRLAIIPSSKCLEAKRNEFSEDFINEISKFSEKARGLLENLLTITSFKKLDRELSSKIWHFYLLKNDLYYLFLNEFSQKKRDEDVFKKEFLSILEQSYEDLKDTIKEETESLSPSQRRHLLYAIEGLSCFSLNFIEGLLNTNQLPLEESILSKILESFLKAEICVTAIFFFLDINWRSQKTLHLLIRAANKYVMDVEDILLTSDPTLKRRLTERTESINIGELEQELGLSSRDR